MYITQDMMSLSPRSSPQSSTSGSPSKSSSSDSLPSQLDEERNLFSILQTITANLLQEESFSTLPGLGHLSFSSIASTSVAPRGTSSGLEDTDMQLARDLHSIVLGEASRREPRETHQREPLEEDLHPEENDKLSIGPILLPTDIDSLDEILDSYCEATILNLNNKNNAESNDNDAYSSSGSTVDSILVYKARIQRKSIVEAANA